MIKTISDDFFNKAMAFLEVAIISSKEKENIYFHTAEYSNVTAYLVYHATELFLKFAIFQASKKLVEGHDIFNLLNLKMFVMATFQKNRSRNLKQNIKCLLNNN